MAEIAPWGTADDPHLHWFGLSDGLYWIQAGDAELFRFSSALMNHRWQEYQAHLEHPQERETAKPPQIYADWFVVRLWEDILALLPAILVPLPPELLLRLVSLDAWKQWYDHVDQWVEVTVEDADDTEWKRRSDIRTEALQWWWDCHLYTGPFICGPDIHFWSDGELMHCAWDNRQFFLDDFPAWEAVYGEVTLPVTQFIEAVISFHERFIAAMEERVQEAHAHWSRPDIKIDLTQLAREQQTRSGELAKRLAQASANTHKSWDGVLEAIRTIETSPDF